MNNGKTNVTASLINSAVWDRTMNWLEETNAVTRAELFDSTSWGNYNNSKFNFTGKYSTDYGDNFTDATASTEKPENSSYLLGTGVTDYTKINNIYDLAGNCYEWTTESRSSDFRIYRGGRYYINGSDQPASNRRVNVPGYSNSYVTFRSALYVNT